MSLYERLSAKEDAVRRRIELYSIIRRYFGERGFHEVETPVLARWYGLDINIEPFATQYTGEKKLYLQVSPEFFLKKLVIAGYEKVFEIARVFRNGEYTPLHNPEFTMLEWYEQGKDYEDIMSDVENLLSYICRRFRPDWNLNTSVPWKRISLREIFYDHTGIDIDEFKDDVKPFLEKASMQGYNIKAGYSWDELFFLLFVDKVEPNIPRDIPLFVYDYPHPLGGMAKMKDDFYTERFELYLGGVEIANGYSELTDPDEQLRRWKIVGDAIDVDFIDGLRMYKGSIGGVAVGLDRLLMLMLGKDVLGDVILFPFRDVGGIDGEDRTHK